MKATAITFILLLSVTCYAGQESLRSMGISSCYLLEKGDPYGGQLSHHMSTSTYERKTANCPEVVFVNMVLDDLHVHATRLARFMLLEDDHRQNFHTCTYQNATPIRFQERGFSFSYDEKMLTCDYWLRK